MKKLKKASIRVTDIAMQYWCEKQMELNYLFGPKFVAPEKVDAGKRLHEELEKEISVPIDLQPKNYADYLFKDFYKGYTSMSLLGKNKKAREISIYGMEDNFKLIGKIDEIDIRDGSAVIVENKTRESNKIPSEAQTLTNKIQIIIYRKLLNDILQNRFGYEKFNAVYSLTRMHLTAEFVTQLDALGVEKGMQSLNEVSKKFFDSIARMKNMDDEMYLKYINRNTGEVMKSVEIKYDENYARDVLAFTMKYWRGARQALPVPEKETWKCSFCKFRGNECKAWYNGAE
ncbi:exonuclease V [Candidatus Marsarchaeota archaeon]|nr:exonuclease V [Candidatus Marsarchaeota archaeon]